VKIRPTIFARASGAGRAGVAVFRVSGTDAMKALDLVGGGSPAAKSAVRRTVQDPVTGNRIDDALVMRFQGPHSFTGEDVVEIQTHGSLAVERAMFRMLGDIPGFRMAEPGEFTRRAWENGKMDLLQVEGIADIVDAETEAQLRLAMRSFAGEASEAVQSWRSQLTLALALLDAAIDFPEEGDDTGSYATEIASKIKSVREQLLREIEGSEAAECIRNGIEVAVIGPPNVGKSSLFNRIAGRDAAISSPSPGTTRDIVEVRLSVRQLPVTLLDTAGLGDPSNDVEAEGMRRANHRAELANLRLHVVAPDVEFVDPRDGPLWSRGDIGVANKCDFGRTPVSREAISVSASTNEGVAELVEQIGNRFAWLEDMASPAAALARRRNVLRDCCEALDEASFDLDREAPEVIAEHIRVALDALGALAGRVDVEEVLDVIFREFCIGK